MAKKEITEEEKIDNQILDLLMKKGIKTAPEISKALNQMYGKVVQRLLDEEFNEFMEYEKGSHVNKKDTNRRNGSTSKGKKVKTESVKFFTSEIIVSKLEEPQYRQLVEQMLSKENIEKMKKRAEAVQGEATKEGIYLGSIEGKELVFAKEQFAAVMKANLGKELEKEKQTKQKGEV